MRARARLLVSHCALHSTVQPAERLDRAAKQCELMGFQHES